MDFKKLPFKNFFCLAIDIFEIFKSYPKEKTYSLTDQIRRCSLFVCSCLAEAYRKRRYAKHFISKLTDADRENPETSTCLDFAYHCKCINEDIYIDFTERCEGLGKLINKMINNPHKFGVKIN